MFDVKNLDTEEIIAIDDGDSSGISNAQLVNDVICGGMRLTVSQSDDDIYFDSTVLIDISLNQ